MTISDRLLSLSWPKHAAQITNLAEMHTNEEKQTTRGDLTHRLQAGLLKNDNFSETLPSHQSSTRDTATK